MTSSARNAVIAVAVAGVVAVAAAPFVIRGLRAEKAVEAPTATESYQETYSFPQAVEEDTTAMDILDEILQTMNEQPTNQTVQAQSQQSYTPQPTQTSQQTQKQQNTPPATTAKQTQKAESTTAFWQRKITTTQKAATTAKAAKTTEAPKQTQATTPVGTPDQLKAVSGPEAMKEGGVVSYLYNPEGNFYYVEDNPWQRNFGFNVLYDWAAATMVLFYDTWRAHFDYDGLEWMIQAWKGQYGFLFIGGEIGVYNRTPGSTMVTSSHYNCADDNHLINMEMTIWYDERKGQGYQKLFTRTYYPHWWSTGFVDGHLADYKFNDRTCLIQTARLTMYDQEMLDAFTDALEHEVGFRRVDSVSDVTINNPDTFAVSGLDVYYAWKTIDQGYKDRDSGTKAS